MEMTVVNLRFRHGQQSFGTCELGLLFINRLLRDRVGFGKTVNSRHFAFLFIKVDFRLGKLRAFLVVVEPDEQLPRLHPVAVFKLDFNDFCRNGCRNLHSLFCASGSERFDHIGELLFFLHLRNNGGRHRRTLLRYSA